MEDKLFFVCQPHEYAPFEVTTLAGDPTIVSLPFEVEAHAKLTCTLFNEETNFGVSELGPTICWDIRLTFWNACVNAMKELGKKV